jgi:fibronectin-binding autotransporter adhesin
MMVIGSGISASAATATWTGGDTAGSWRSADNWGGTLPTFNNTLDITFYSSGAGNLTNFIHTTSTIRSLTFNENVDSDVIIRLTSRADGAVARGLRFQSDDPSTTSPSITVESGASANIDIGGEGTEGTMGNIALSSTLAVTHNGSGLLTFSRPIGDVGGITKLGNGTLILAANNTYSGTTTLSAGVVVADHANALGTGNITFDGTGTLRYTVNSAGTDWASRIVNSGAAIALDTDTNIVTLAGVIDDSNVAGLVKSGLGALALAGNNTYAGTTTVSEGILAIAHGNALGSTAAGTIVASGAQLRLTNVTVGNEALTINGAGLSAGDGTAGALRSTGTNTWGGKVTLGSDARIFGGNGTQLTLDVASGEAVDLGSFTLTIDGQGTTQVNDAIVGTGGLLKTGGGVSVLAASSSFSGGTTLSAGMLRLDHINAAGSGQITQTSGASTLQINTSGTIANNMSVYNVAFLQGATLSGNITVNNATFDVVANETSTISGVIDGTAGVNKTGLGQLTLTGDNTYTGATVVNAGILELASMGGEAAGATGSVSVAGNATLLISQSNQVNPAAAVTLSGGTIQRGSGVSEVFGALNLDSASVLDFGSGTSGTMSFGIYEANATPSALLTVNNFFGGNTLTFGSDLSSYITSSYSGTAFTSEFFNINSTSGGFTSDWNGSTFTITAIPEPSTYLAAAGLFAVLLWPSRRRLLKDAKSVLGLRRPMRDRLG